MVISMSMGMWNIVRLVMKTGALSFGFGWWVQSDSTGLALQSKG
jgi:hypothetical protein